MPSKPDSQFAFRDRELAEVYDRDFGRDRRHAAAKVRLQRWEIAHRVLLAEINLSVEEAQILHYLLSSSRSCSEDTLESLEVNLQLLRASVVDGLEDYAQRLDVQALSAKIQAWTTAQWYAVLDACDRVGGGAYHIEDIVAALKDVGLAR